MIDQTTLLKAGIAAFLPGMRLMLEEMTNQVAKYREMLDSLERGDTSNGFPLLLNGTVKKRMGRPPKALLAAVANGHAEVQNTAPIVPNKRKTKIAKRTTVKSPEGLISTSDMARELGITNDGARKFAQTHGVEVRLIQDPKGFRTGHVTLADFERLKQKRTGKAAQVNASRQANTEGYWAQMTPEERQAEMQRRMAMRGKAKKPTPTHIGANYTVAGIREALGIGELKVRNTLAGIGIKPEMVKNPVSPTGTLIGVITPQQFAVVEKALKERKAK